MATFDPSRLSSVGLTSLEVVAYRNQAPGFDPRSGEGARRFGGRFNPPRSFPVLYLCLSRQCVVAELTAQASRQSVQVGDLLPREMWSVSTSLDQVLDLTAAAELASLGIAMEDLTRPDHPFTQEIGEVAHERQVQAIRSPSATGVDDVLAVFSENLGAVTLHVELVETWSSVSDL
jgi:RES domain-containing protein